MKKLLILGAMEMHVPLIKRAKEMGNYVITVDYIPENPGHNLADEAYYDSTTDLDAVLKLSKKLPRFQMIRCVNVYPFYHIVQN